MKNTFITVLLFFITGSASAQAVVENVNNSIYDYLYRNAQKGNIELNDMVRPLLRNQIAGYLKEIKTKAESDPKVLNTIERKELDFYIAEYGLGVIDGVKNTGKEQFMKKDPRGRVRFFALIQDEGTGNREQGTGNSLPAGRQGNSEKKLLDNHDNKDNKIQPFQFNLAPILQGSVAASDANNYFITRATGLQLWASLGKRWGFQAYYRDVFENGEGIDFDRAFTPNPGIVKVTNPTAKSLNYADVRASVHYNWNSGALSIGKEQYVVGYGINGNLINSTKAPSFPYLRLQQNILKWLKFEYTHAVLSSGLVDTPNSYRVDNGGVFGGQRFKMVPKYYVNHSVLIQLMKGLNLQVGESVIYTDKIQPGYFLPLMFFKAWDQYISGNNLNAGANTQIFAQLSSRNQLKNTHLYTTLFIDEVSPQVIFNSAKSRNQLGFNIGGSITDIPGLPYLTLNAEYTRINPFLYQNLLPAQFYDNNGYVMGDWMGSNSDRLIGEIKYTPIPRLRLSVRHEMIRKGGANSIEQQYFAQPQPKFLNNLQFKQTQTIGRAVYEWKQNLYFHAMAERRQLERFTGDFSNSTQYFFTAGFALGL
jgi:hypothetical protein